MATPKNELTSLWDMMRRRWKVDVSKATSKQKLIKQVRQGMGLRSRQKSKGDDKSFLRMLRTSDFWKQSKSEAISGRRRRGQHKGLDWNEGESAILRSLKDRGLGGKQLTDNFNARVSPHRSHTSIQVKASRIKVK